jgi:polysaccharide chain length determinant protein (PEP-CTERM system associated)
MHELAYQLLSHAKATWHYRWFAVMVAWIIALGGWATVHRMPDRYEASARVWLNTQSVVKNLMYGLTTQPNVDQMVGMISRTMMSRPNLEKLIRMAGMDIELKSPREREQLTTRLSREVTLQSAGGVNLFTISYTDKDPQKAKLVVQSLLTIFVESSLGEQRTDAEEAERFIDEELKTSKEKLDVAENTVIEFKRRQTGLKSGRGDYSAQLVAAEAALNEALLELKIAEINRDASKKNFQDAEEFPSLLGDRGPEVGARSEIDARINALEQKLDDLRLTYTDQHPDIVAIERTIAQLKEQSKAQAMSRQISPRTVQTLEPVQRQSTLPLALTLAAAAVEANVAAAKARVEEYGKRYNELKAAAVAAPEIDAEYTDLLRNYEIAKNYYGTLLARRETARISAKMEAQTKATDFRVVDPPQVPSLPKAPNRQLLNSIALLMALGGGASFAFLLSQIRPTFNDERKLQEVTGVPVLGTVNMVWTDVQKARRTWGLIAFVISFASLLSAYAAINSALTLIASRA